MQKGFSQDESAIAQILAKMAVSKTPYPLEEALQDAYMAILLRQAVKEKGSIASREMIWQG